MRIVEMYSHLNGYEHILVHRPGTWDDITEAVHQTDAEACRVKVSKEKGMKGQMLLSPSELNQSFKSLFVARGWDESRVTYWVSADERVIRKTLTLPVEEQKEQIIAAGYRPIRSYNQTDFVKDRIAVEVQFGKYSFVAYDLFVKHMAFYVGDQIDVGVEILPMKEMSEQMSSGIAYYEGELYNVIRQGRGVPAVPLVLVGIAP